MDSKYVGPEYEDEDRFVDNDIYGLILKQEPEESSEELEEE